MLRRFFSLLILPILLFSLASGAQARMTYGSGEYTNLCGTGFEASAHTCNAGCNAGSGTCQADGDFVVKFVCNGKLGECRDGEQPFSRSHGLSASCGQTVQIDVFNKNCRAGGGWSCGDSDLKDYLVWYSGDCPASYVPPPYTPSQPNPPYVPVWPTPVPYATPYVINWPTPTPPPPGSTPPPPATSLCKFVTVPSNPGTVPAKATIQVDASDSRGAIQGYRFFFGDGQSLETTNSSVEHEYTSSGTFRPRVDIRDSQGVWQRERWCETQLTVGSSPVESHRSGCSDLHVLAGHNQNAPTTVEYQVLGYDNKGSLQKYRIDFGNGVIKEQDGEFFAQRYDQPGTYTVKAAVKDSTGEWRESAACTQSVSVQSAITVQPKTGAPTLLTVLALGLTTGGSLLAWNYRPVAQKTSRRR